MNIYYFETRNEQAYLSTPDGDGEQCEPDPPRSLAAEWSSPRFMLETSDDFGRPLTRCDFPTYLWSALILSASAADRLRPIVTTCGELLPLDVINDRDKYFLFNVTRVINAVDMKKSKFMELPSGSIGPCELLVFDPRAIPSDALFFKNTQMGPAIRVFATEQAVALVEQAGLTGYEFQLAWSDV